MSATMRFLGADLAWKDGNPSGVALLAGRQFPLRLSETPRTLASHRTVLGWIRRHVRRHPSAVGIDAPLLGLERERARRLCDDAIARVFGRFDASTYSPSQVPALQAFTRALIRAYGLVSFAPDIVPRAGRPAIREVYPNALQVLLFALDRRHGAKILKYKRRRFITRRAWVEDGLRPFIERCIEVCKRRYVVTSETAWQALVADTPTASMSAAHLKSIEDRWDALLCALAVALECLEPGSVHLYAPVGWTAGAILAPILCPPADHGRRPRRSIGRFRTRPS